MLIKILLGLFISRLRLCFVATMNVDFFLSRSDPKKIMVLPEFSFSPKAELSP